MKASSFRKAAFLSSDGMKSVFSRVLRGISPQRSLSGCSGCRWPSSTASLCGKETNWRRGPRFSNRQRPLRPPQPPLRYLMKVKNRLWRPTSSHTPSLGLSNQSGVRMRVAVPALWIRAGPVEPFTLTNPHWCTNTHMTCAALIAATAR